MILVSVPDLFTFVVPVTPLNLPKFLVIILIRSFMYGVKQCAAPVSRIGRLSLSFPFRSYSIWLISPDGSGGSGGFF